MRVIRVKFSFRRKDLNQWYANIFCRILNEKFQVELDEIDPDYIFHDAHLVDVIKFKGVRLAFSGENVRIDFNISDYGIGFDHLSFKDRFLRFPLYLFYKESVKAAEIRPHFILDSDADSLVNRKFCNFLVSNGTATEFRTKFFNRLSQYRTVDSGGRYLNNIGGHIVDKSSWQQDYKFSLCFENSSTSGYLTEKLIQAYAAKTIPIYWGDPDAFGSIRDGFGGINPEAIILVDQKNPDFAIDQIKELDSNPTLYFEMLKQPLFLDQDHVQWFEQSLNKYLYNIFDQDREDAYRRGFGQVRLRVENRNIARSSYLKSVLKYLKNRLRI